MKNLAFGKVTLGLATDLLNFWQTQQSPHKDQPRATTKKKYLVEGWEFFDAYRKKDTTNTTQAPSKNGGNDKTNTKTPAPAKNGKPTCDNKKAAAK